MMSISSLTTVKDLSRSVMEWMATVLDQNSCLDGFWLLGQELDNAEENTRFVGRKSIRKILLVRGRLSLRGEPVVDLDPLGQIELAGQTQPDEKTSPSQGVSELGLQVSEP